MEGIQQILKIKLLLKLADVHMILIITTYMHTSHQWEL